MSNTARQFADADSEAWDAFVDTRPEASLYHRRSWAKVVAESFGFREQSLVALRDGAIVGVLPLWRVGRRLTSNAPWRDRARPLAVDADALNTIAVAVARHGGSLVLKDWPEALPLDGTFRRERYWVTSVLDLTQPSDQLWATVNRAVGRNIRKAESLGVVVSQSRDSAALDRFYHLFCHARRDIGVPIYPRHMFESMARNLAEGEFDIVIAEHGGRPVAGAVFLGTATETIYGYGGSIPEAGPLRAMDLLMWHAIRHSQTLGRTRFDFGADSPDQESLLRFKAKWGATQRQIPWAVTSVQPSAASGNPAGRRYALLRGLLRRLPVLALRLAGHLVVRSRG